ncbi:MAG: radical SAM protein [Desulfurivibrionaceae bacterium]|nr:radical SAM protein [Pseudomonadota bacterium]MCG2824851.1 radical SAM protein [Desulfobulbaceae bacterium]MDP2001673.1 radical SAM protein [Desulfurivibrionaceae bacterium]MBU4230207.1 radical SAM protein [Pseudomonadota bacterium]MBU4412834.1 radical SAM protein [Pseudomonadota bacterium]
MRDETTLQLSEIFYSIQGESSLAGYPCLFFRLSGCNLRCSYCDAKYTYEEPATPTPLGTLLTEAARYPNALIEITGGEPLLQEEVYPLMDALLAAGRTVLLETNGSLCIARVPKEVVKIVDLKCPDSTMAEKMNLANLDLLAPHDEVKFVVNSRGDYDWARAMMRKHRLAEKAKVILSPVLGRLAPALLAQWLMADALPARLQLQLHTLLWPGMKRGV